MPSTRNASHAAAVFASEGDLAEEEGLRQLQQLVQEQDDGANVQDDDIDETDDDGEDGLDEDTAAAAGAPTAIESNNGTPSSSAAPPPNGSSFAIPPPPVIDQTRFGDLSWTAREGPVSLDPNGQPWRYPKLRGKLGGSNLFLFKDEIEERTKNGQGCKAIAELLVARGVDTTARAVAGQRAKWGFRQRAVRRMTEQGLANIRKAHVEMAKRAASKPTGPVKSARIRAKRKAEITRMTKEGMTPAEIAADLKARGFELSSRGAVTVERLRTVWGLTDNSQRSIQNIRNTSRSMAMRVQKQQFENIARELGIANVDEWVKAKMDEEVAQDARQEYAFKLMGDARPNPVQKALLRRNAVHARFAAMKAALVAQQNEAEMSSAQPQPLPPPHHPQPYYHPGPPPVQQGNGPMPPYPLGYSQPLAQPVQQVNGYIPPHVPAHTHPAQQGNGPVPSNLPPQPQPYNAASYQPAQQGPPSPPTPPAQAAQVAAATATAQPSPPVANHSTGAPEIIRVPSGEDDTEDENDYDDDEDEEMEDGSSTSQPAGSKSAEPAAKTQEAETPVVSQVPLTTLPVTSSTPGSVQAPDSIPTAGSHPPQMPPQQSFGPPPRPNSNYNGLAHQQPSPSSGQYPQQNPQPGQPQPSKGFVRSFASGTPAEYPAPYNNPHHNARPPPPPPRQPQPLRPLAPRQFIPQPLTPHPTARGHPRQKEADYMAQFGLRPYSTEKFPQRYMTPQGLITTDGYEYLAAAPPPPPPGYHPPPLQPPPSIPVRLVPPGEVLSSPPPQPQPAQSLAANNNSNSRSSNNNNDIDNSSTALAPMPLPPPSPPPQPKYSYIPNPPLVITPEEVTQHQEELKTMEAHRKLVQECMDFLSARAERRPVVGSLTGLPPSLKDIQDAREKLKEFTSALLADGQEV